MKRFRTLIGIAAALLLAPAAFAAEEEQKEQQPPPSFRPGAEVELQVTISAPEKWHLNEGLAVTLSFDEEYLKKAPFSTKSSEVSISTEPGDLSTQLSMKITLGSELPDGSLSLPLDLMCVVCDKTGDNCVMISESFSAVIEVRSSAPKDAKNQALKSGANPVEFRIPAPY